MKILKASILLMMAVFVLAGAVSAEPVRIAAITDKIDGPTRVAIDGKGNLYVTQPAKNAVLLYSSEGKYLKSFFVRYPVGIAVDAAGTIYVGSAASGMKQGSQNSVLKFTADLTPAGSLGAGAGEVGYPNDIAVDAAGKVYVADSVNHVVKVFDPVAGTSFQFGSFGSASGYFKRPSSIAVNDQAGAAGEVYVVDYPVVSTPNGPADGARIQVFNKTGQFQRYFGQFGDATGQMRSPAGIAIASTGTLYVSDSHKNIVHIFNPADGTLVGSGAIYDSLYVPTGVAISRNNLLYVASYRGGDSGNGRILVYGLDGYVTMAVDPLALMFSGTQYTGNPDPQTIVISNTGSGTLNWTATADQDWIKLGKQDPVGPKSAGGLGVGVDISTFGIGSHTGTITIDSGFRKKTVGVTVAIAPAPVLNIGNGWLNFTAKKGSNPSAQSVTLGVDNLVAPIAWNVTGDAPWIAVTPGAGTASAAVPATTTTVSVNTSGLAVGSYTGLLTVSAPGAIGTGSKITVNLTVSPSSKLAVQTNLADAKFTVSGPATYSGSGAAWSVDNAPAGQYTVTFDAVNGYKKPAAQTKTLSADGEAAFIASYVSWNDLAAKKNIVVAKGPDARNDSRVALYTANGTTVPFDLVPLDTPFGANVAVGDVDGDGNADLVVGAGTGANNPARVRVIRMADKSEIASFIPFGSLSGAKVAAGDLNGDGKAEVVVSSPANGGELAVYTLENGVMVPTGLLLSGAIYSAIGDTEGDGLPEIVTASGNYIRIWKIDFAGAVGAWKAAVVKKIYRSLVSSVAAADMNGDGIDEIVAGKSGSGLVTVFFADGTKTDIKAYVSYNTTVAAADLDGDGNAEVIVGRGVAITAGTSDLQQSLVRVYSASGVLKYSLNPFGRVHDGVTAAVGDLGF